MNFITDKSMFPNFPAQVSQFVESESGLSESAHSPRCSTARVLFIGATGRVGHQVVPLLRDEFEVTAAALGGGEVDGQPVSEVDITDWDSVERLVCAGDAQGRPFDALINCAIANPYDFDRKDPDAMHSYFESCIEVNARGSYHIYEAARRAGVKRVVYVSSLTTVLGAPRYATIDAETRDRPRDVYAICKLFGEQVGRTYAFPHDKSDGLQVACLRLGMPYPVLTGSDRGWQNNRGRRALIVHVEDVAHSIRCALTLPPDARYGVYSIVSDSDNPMVNPNAYAGLGYRPRWNFTDQGASRSER